MNTDHFGETLQNSSEGVAESSMKDPLVKLGFTPSFNAVEF